jgi:hypothetical protein
MTRRQSVAPSELLNIIRTINPMFRGFHQHDSQEFLSFLLDQLHEELKIPLTLQTHSNKEPTSSLPSPSRTPPPPPSQTQSETTSGVSSAIFSDKSLNNHRFRVKKSNSDSNSEDDDDDDDDEGCLSNGDGDGDDDSYKTCTDESMTTSTSKFTELNLKSLINFFDYFFFFLNLKRFQ